MTEAPARPEDIPAAFAAAWATRDGAAIGALFAEDAEFVNVVGLWWHDRHAISRAHDRALKTFFAETRLTPGAVRVRRLGSGHAVVQCRFRLTGQRAPDGGTGEERRTILTFVAEARERGWIVVAAQNTDIAPGAESLLQGPDDLSPVDYRSP